MPPLFISPIHIFESLNKIVLKLLLTFLQSIIQFTQKSLTLLNIRAPSVETSVTAIHTITISVLILTQTKPPSHNSTPKITHQNCNPFSLSLSTQANTHFTQHYYFHHYFSKSTKQMNYS